MSESTPGSASQPPPLSDDEARQLTEHLAVVAQSGLPLAPALRAAAAETPNRSVASAMTTLAAELESGRALEEVLALHPRVLPAYMRRMVETGIRSGRLAEVLVKLIELDRSSQDVRRSFIAAIAYPVLLFVLSVLLIVLLSVQVVPGLIEVLNDFNTELPWSTQVLASISGHRVLTAFGILVAAIPMLIVLLRVGLRPAGWRRLLTRIPLVGPMLLWRGVANWLRLLALLLNHGLPVPESVRLAADGVDDPLLAVVGLRIAKSMEAGRKLADAIHSVRVLPASLTPIVRWGEEHGALADSLDTAAEMFEARIRLRAALVQAIFPPIAFIFIALGVMYLMNALFMPMVTLVQSLSRGWTSRPSTGGPLASGIDWESLVERAAYWVVVTWAIMTLLIWLRWSAVATIVLPLFGLDPYRTPAREPNAFVQAFKFVYWFLFFCTLLIAMIVLGGLVFGILLWIVSVVILVMVRIRYAETERRTLLWVLAVAAEKGIPLPAAARSFADERRDGIGRRARRLADLLERGLPLDVAVADSGTRLSNDALVAVRTGCDTGALADLLKQSASSAATLDLPIHALFAKAVYLTVFVFFAAATIAFLMIKIVPAFQKIFSDFKTDLPLMTQALVDTAYFLVQFGVLPIIGVIGLFAILGYVLARYSGLTRWDAPLLRRVALPLDQAVVLRSLAATIDRHFPLQDTIDSLARQYPKEHIARRLRRASNQMSEGVHWCDSLRESGLLSAADAGLLHAAERVGNLLWAMNDLADRLTRRFIIRMTALMAVAFPLAMLLVAGFVMFVTVALFTPLVKLIMDLS